MTKYSQNEEEAAIVKHLDGVTGRFLDIGAYDGITFSNTHRLLELGWNGVLIEPSPAVFALLLNRVAAFRPRAICLSFGVLPNSAGRLSHQPMTLHECAGDAVSTFVQDHRNKWAAANFQFNAVSVPCISMIELMEEVGLDFEMVNIDTEGCSAKLFFDLPIGDMPKLKLICVEHDSEITTILERAALFGFSESYRSGENLVLVR